MSTFLEQWNNPDLDVPLDWDPNEEGIKQRERLVNQAVTAMFSHGMKRRIPDATPEELATDKRRSKVIYHRSVTSLRMWEGEPADVDEKFDENPDVLRQAGAQVIWENWWEHQKQFLRNELQRIATTALRTGQFKAGNRFCNRLLNELNILGKEFE